MMATEQMHCLSCCCTWNQHTVHQMWPRMRIWPCGWPTSQGGPLGQLYEKPKKAIKIEREGTPGGSMLKQGPRCAKCVKSHKRCTHRTQQSPTPQPGPEGSFGVFSVAANNVPVSDDAPEGYTPAPQAIPEPSLTEHTAMPTPLTTGKTTSMKRKR